MHLVASHLRTVGDAAAPPHDLAAEQAVLGSLLLSAAARNEVATLIDATDFYKPAHTTIYTTIAAQHATGSAVDIILIADQLHHNETLTSAGGAAYLHELIRDTPLAANAAHYARIVRQHADRRRLIDSASRAQQAAYQTADPDTVADELRRSLDHLTRSETVRTPDPDLDTFLAEDEPTYDFVIPGLLERGDRLIVTGPEGYGKSTLLRQISLQAAAGIHPFTLDRTEPVRVLLIDLENSRAHFKRELWHMRGKLGTSLAAGQHTPLSRPSGLDLLDTRDRTWLEETIAANKPDVLVTGPLYKLATGNPNDEEIARKVAFTLDQLRTTYGFALILEAHQPHAPSGGQRPRRVYGASLWLRWPEFGLHLSETGALSHWRGARDERDWPAALKRGGQWPWTVETNPREVLWNRIREACLNAGKVLSRRDLAAALEASVGHIHEVIHDHKTAWDALAETIKEGQLT